VSESRISFEVEEAGCESCGKLVRAALREVGTVENLEIDAAADLATVVLAGGASRSAVDAALADASAGAGHAYRVRAGSWRTLD
jgi:copper chaperone CopZ